MARDCVRHTFADAMAFCRLLEGVTPSVIWSHSAVCDTEPPRPAASRSRVFTARGRCGFVGSLLAGAAFPEL